MGVHGALARPVLVAPDLAQQLLAVVHHAGPPGQVVQEVELARGQVDLRAVDARLAGGGVDGEVADADRLRFVLVGRGPAGPAQQRPQPGDQLLHAERLGHVVVGAHAEADEQIRLRVPRGEHEHRHVAIALDLLADLQPVHAREHQVEHHRVGPQRPAQLDPARPVSGGLYLEALLAQPRGDRVRDDALVLDHGDAGSLHGGEGTAGVLVWGGGRVEVWCRAGHVTRQNREQARQRRGRSGGLAVGVEGLPQPHPVLFPQLEHV